MITRLFVIVLVGALGVAVGSLVPDVSQAVRTAIASVPIPALARLGARESLNGSAEQPSDVKGEHEADSNGHAHDAEKDAHTGDDRDAPEHGAAEDEHEEEAPEGTLKLSSEQIASARIETTKASEGLLARRLTVPGTIIPAADRVARVAAKVVGTVAELNKQLGDPVAKGEVVAVLESREVAETKSEYLAASVNFDLQKTLFEREQGLFRKNITAEQQFLRARTTFSEVQLRVDLARQKLFALGVPQEEITALSRQTPALQRYELRSPITGRIVERIVDLGAPVGGEGQAEELYGIADLSQVWVELAISPRDLPSVKEEQPVQITMGGTNEKVQGKIIFKSPILSQETRSARVIAHLPNQSGTWQPGAFVTANIAVEEQEVPLVVPTSALQTIDKDQVVFVRTPEGFKKREVALGRSDSQATEIVRGLDPGEEIAITNTFTLKAELGKSEASHAH